MVIPIIAAGAALVTAFFMGCETEKQPPEPNPSEDKNSNANEPVFNCNPASCQVLQEFDFIEDNSIPYLNSYSPSNSNPKCGGFISSCFGNQAINVGKYPKQLGIKMHVNMAMDYFRLDIMPTKGCYQEYRGSTDINFEDPLQMSFDLFIGDEQKIFSSKQYLDRCLYTEAVKFTKYEIPPSGDVNVNFDNIQTQGSEYREQTVGLSKMRLVGCKCSAEEKMGGI